MITLKDVKEALQLIETKADYDYFFNKIDSPDWIEPLRKEGYFSDPPGTTREGFATPWPESRFLARVADKAPELVCEVVGSVGDTQNPLVQGDFIDAAMKMPPEYAARLASRVGKYMRRRQPLGFAKKLCELTVRLAEGGEMGAALEVAKEILDLEFDEPKDVEEEIRHIARRARGRIQDYRYLEIVGKLSPVLCREGKIKGLMLFMELLSKGIRDEFVWPSRVDIDEHPSMGVRGILVKAVRDGSVLLIEEFPDLKETVLEAIRNQHSCIFHRLEMYLLKRFPEEQEQRIDEIFSDEERFHNTGVRSEYQMLIADQFKNLEKTVQEQYLEWVGKEPDLEKRRKEYESFLGKPVAKEDVLREWHREKLQRLAGLKEALPPEWKRVYEQLAKECGGEPEVHPGVRMESSAGFFAYGSPKTADELGKMSLEEVVEFLKRWEPPRQWDPEKECPDGLARELDIVVKKDIAEYARSATLFVGVRPTYLRHLIMDFYGACREGQGFDWPPVLELCEFITQQPLELKPERNKRDNDWSGAQGAVLDFISEAFSTEQNQIPFELRDSVWRCLSRLTDSPDPEPEREERYIRDNQRYDPINVAINSTRGKAMGAVIRYGLWVRNNTERATEVISNFDGLEEAREVLDAHLDTEKEKSTAIRAIYGEWFPWLTLLGQNWAREKRDAIFPAGESGKEKFWDAAWMTYIQFCNVYDDVFLLLRDKYEWALDHVGSKREKGTSHDDPNIRLTSHLVILYARGVLGNDDGLWKKFWSSGTVEMRKEAIEFVGRLAGREEKAVPAIVIGRFKALLEDRLKAAEVGAKQQSLFSDELVGYGRWFESRHFEDEWALTQLERVLKLTGGQISWAEKVIERLEELFEKYGLRVLRCLKRIVDGDSEGWGMIGYQDTSKRILEQGKGSSDREIRDRTLELVDYLGAAGYQQFRELADI